MKENDNNKNRKYPAIDGRVSRTYGRASEASLLRKLNDPYVKAIRWASDRIGDEGVVALVTNNSFIAEITFDGMRKCLTDDFDAIYVLDLGGNVRKNPKLSGTTHNVFGIQVGVSISLFIRKKAKQPRQARVRYARVDESWRKEEKYNFLAQREHLGNVEWQEIKPDEKHNWLTEGMREDFKSFLPIGTKEESETKSIFSTYSLGVSTNRDAWVYNFREDELRNNVARFCEPYNVELDRWKREGRAKDILSFVSKDELKTKW